MFYELLSREGETGHAWGDVTVALVLTACVIWKVSRMMEVRPGVWEQEQRFLLLFEAASSLCRQTYIKTACIVNCSRDGKRKAMSSSGNDEVGEV